MCLSRGVRYGKAHATTSQLFVQLQLSRGLIQVAAVTVVTMVRVIERAPPRRVILTSPFCFDDISTPTSIKCDLPIVELPDLFVATPRNKALVCDPRFTAIGKCSISKPDGCRSICSADGLAKSPQE